MPFQPGRSGNPGGRPKVVGEIRDFARDHSSVTIAALVEIAQSGKQESARVSAAIRVQSQLGSGSGASRLVQVFDRV
jgi:hypothetical protein